MQSTEAMVKKQKGQKKPIVKTALLCLVLIAAVIGCIIWSHKGKKTIVEDKLIIGTDYRLPYFDFGKGEKNFILLPGASMNSILGSEDGIKALFEPYTGDFHIYVFDVPEDLESVTDIGCLAEIVADASDALGIKEADVYGVSLGGMTAQELAIHHPNLVHTLTLASSMSRNNELSSKVISGWTKISDPEELAKEVNVSIYSEEFYGTYVEAFHELERNATAEGVERLHYLTRMIEDFSVYDELEQIKCPVYIFAGSDDNTLGVEASTEIAEKLGCYIKVYENYPHAVYDEFPGFYDGVFSNLK